MDSVKRRVYCVQDHLVLGSVLKQREKLHKAIALVPELGTLNLLELANSP